MTGYRRPTTVAEAVGLLAADADARPLAGGATLVAMMNADLVAPSTLVSLGGIPELRALERLPDGSVRLGAMRRHAENAVADLAPGPDVVRRAAQRIANPVVRNMGTIGGSIAFADPGADYPAALVAAGATIEIAGPGGARTVSADAFFVDWYTTALEAGEIVTGIVLPPGGAGSASAYDKLVRVSGDFAIVSVAAVLRLEKGAVATLRVAVGGCGPKPVRVPEAEQAVLGGPLAGPAVAALGAALAAASDPPDDVRATSAYRHRVIPGLVARALAAAAAPQGLAA
jgi:carbon-monoxide dehydrogenase medium subunit